MPKASSAEGRAEGGPTRPFGERSGDGAKRSWEQETPRGFSPQEVAPR